MKYMKIFLVLALVACLLTGCCMQHEWMTASCAAPKTCEKCGKTEGELLTHTWQEATCELPQICANCGAIQGEALGHSWAAATCETEKTCTRCAATEGEPLKHKLGGGKLVSRWLESEQKVATVHLLTCKDCGQEVWHHALDAVIRGSWGGESYESSGKKGNLDPEKYFMEFFPDGMAFFVEREGGNFLEWESLGVTAAGNTENLEERVRAGEDIYWDQTVLLTIDDVTIYATIPGENTDRLNLRNGSAVRNFRRGRPITQLEMEAAKEVAGKWELRCVAYSDDEVFPASEIDLAIEMMFADDGTVFAVQMNGEKERTFDGRWQFVRRTEVAGQEAALYEVELDYAYQMILMNCTEKVVEDMRNLVDPGYAIKLKSGNMILFFSPVR